MNTRDRIVLIFVVLSCVSQGCPLFGSLFAMAIAPLLHMLKIQLESASLAWVRACADDISIALSQISNLPDVQILFDAHKHISGLSLKAIKCIIILNALLASPDSCSMLRQWLKNHCPGWESMSVCNCAGYLGILLGPTPGSLQWQKALKKFQDRVTSIHTLHLPAELAKGQYSTLPTLHYLAQIVPPPPNSKTIGMKAVMTCFHMCGNSLSNKCAVSLDCLGGLNFLTFTHTWCLQMSELPRKPLKGMWSNMTVY